MARNRPRNYMIFRRPRTQAIKALNNIYVINSIARNSLREAKGALEAKPKAKLNFEIPTVSGDSISVARRRTKVLSLLKGTIDRDLFEQSIVAGVAIAEDYLATTLRTVFGWYPEKLSTGEKKVDLSLILECDDMDELLSRLVEKRIHSVFYGSPSEYFGFIEQSLAIKIPNDRKENYAEIKATRDLLVHNAGVVNSLYLRKAGKKARALEDEEIPIDPNYFNHCIRWMKKLIGSIYTRTLAKYGNV